MSMCEGPPSKLNMMMDRAGPRAPGPSSRDASTQRGSVNPPNSESAPTLITSRRGTPSHNTLGRPITRSIERLLQVVRRG